MRMSTSRVVASAAGIAAVAGTMVVAPPASAATISFGAFCVAGSSIGDQKEQTQTSMTVSAPSTAAPGQEFTYRIQPGAGSYPDKKSAPIVGSATVTNISRVKYDFEIPANATFVRAAVVDGTGVNLAGTTPNVLRVNESGSVDAAGTILRLSGNNEVIGNSPSSSASSDGGILIPKTKKKLDGTASADGSTWFRLPAIDVTLKAGDSGAIQPRVRIGSGADAKKNAANFNTQLAKASAFGTQYAPTYCTPRDSENGALNAGAGPLATIAITEAGPVDPSDPTDPEKPGNPGGDSGSLSTGSLGF